MMAHAMDTATTLLQFAVGCLFLRAGCAKVFGIRSDSEFLRSLDLPMRSQIAATVAIVELILGGAIMLDWQATTFVPLGLALLVGFTAFLLIIRFGGIAGDCSCGVTLGVQVPPELRNLIIISVLVLTHWWRQTSADVEPAVVNRSRALLAVLAAGAILLSVSYRDGKARMPLRACKEIIDSYAHRCVGRMV